MDAETRAAVAEVARLLARQERDIVALKRGARRPQLAYSSLEEGQSVEVRGPGGEARARIGWLPDGTVGMVTEGGDPVAAPTQPTVTPSLGGLRVTWNGTLANELSLPGDFDHMAVHVSTTSGFEPSADTFEGTIRRAGEGGMLPVVPLPYVEHFVVLVPVTTGGIQGAPSAEVSATPLKTSGVDLEAGSVAAVHIQAGAVEADKLEAVLALVTTIVAGIPGAARVELDQDGLRGYNESGQLIFAIDSSGNAVFTGDITGSDITGSTLRVGELDGDHIRIGAPDVGTGYAITAHGGGSSLEISASTLWSAINMYPPADADQEWFSAFQYAYVAAGDGFVYPAASYSSPATDQILPAGPRSELQLEGSSTTVDASRIRSRADVHHLSMGARTHYDTGVVEVDPELSIRAYAHQYRQTNMASQPSASPTGDFVDFTSGQFSPIAFRTSYSGRVRVDIAMCGVNNSTPGATLSTGFRLSGTSSIGADLSRAAMVRASEPRGGGTNNYGIQQAATVYLTLTGNSDYTLTPAWRATGSGTWGSGSGAELQYDTFYQNSITVTPLM